MNEWDDIILKESNLLQMFFQFTCDEAKTFAPEMSHKTIQKFTKDVDFDTIIMVLGVFVFFLHHFPLGNS